MPTIATHNSRFHADDLFAVATLLKKLEMDDVTRSDIVVKRTRNEEEIAAAEYVVDVGDEYDPARKRFDHHMPGGAKHREAGFPYAAFGLVWEEYGEQITGSLEAANIITEKLVLPIDAGDNGYSTFESVYKNIAPYMIQHVVRSFGPSWREEGDRGFDDGFFEMLDIAGAILNREIEQANAIVEGVEIVKELFENADDKRVIEMDKHYPYERLLPAYDEPLYVLRPDSANNTWKVEAIQEHPYPAGFSVRKPFPKSWCGKRGEKLQKETGVSDAVFAHNAGMLAVADTREGARRLAEIAITA